MKKQITVRTYEQGTGKFLKEEIIEVEMSDKLAIIERLEALEQEVENLKKEIALRETV